MNENEMNEIVMEMIKDSKEFGNYVNDARALRDIYEWAKNNEDEEFVNYVDNMLDDCLSAQG
jgi:hypothetical protein